MRIKLLAALSTVVLLVACAQPVPKVLPLPQGMYEPPIESFTNTARLEGSISRFLTTRIRARVESVDLKGIRIARTPEQPAVILSAGKHMLIAVCETEFATSIDRSDIEFDTEPGHNYLLTCMTNNIWSHGGSEFSVIDQSAGGKVVATAFGPGRATRPRGRLF